MPRKSSVIRKLNTSYTLRHILKNRCFRNDNTIRVLPVFLLSVTAAVVSRLFDLRRGRIVRMRRTFCFDEHVAEIGRDLFQRFYRMNIEQYHQLRKLVEPRLKSRVTRTSVAASTTSVDVMLCVTLRILAGGSYLDLGWPYGIGRSTTFAVFHRTLLVLNEALPAISFPTSVTECKKQSKLFHENRKCQIHGIIAALDGIAVAIQQPRRREVPDPRKYFNRKGFYSLCVQAAVGANYKFIFVSARHAGGTHDSTAFQATLLYKLLVEKKLPLWVKIAADDAYGNGGYLLTPYGGANLGVVRDSFNYYLSSCRVIVEQAFGILVSRFGIFWSSIRFNVSTSTLIVMVTCKLHNFLIDTNQAASFDTLSLAEHNALQGSPIVHSQNDMHMEQWIDRSRQRTREESTERDVIAKHLHDIGLIRPRRKQ